MLGLIRSMDWENVKSPLLFISGMIVGFILVAIIWYFVQLRKAQGKRQLEAEASQPDEGDSDVDADGCAGNNYPSAIIVADANGDYLLEDKMQLGGIIDFKKVPRREVERQAARRELVITMLIAESMNRARKRADYARAIRDDFNRLSLIHDMSNYYGRVRSKVKTNLQPICKGESRGSSYHNKCLDDTFPNSHLYI